jgi:hypothetical protein
MLSLDFTTLETFLKQQLQRQLERLVRLHASLLNNCQQLKLIFLPYVTAPFEQLFRIESSIVGN